MGRRQKGKHMKRRKSWHRGRGEARRWDRARTIFDALEKPMTATTETVAPPSKIALGPAEEAELRPTPLDAQAQRERARAALAEAAQLDREVRASALRDARMILDERREYGGQVVMYDVADMIRIASFILDDQAGA